MVSEAGEPIERWTAKRRMALVVSILKGKTSVAEAALAHGLTVAEVEDWREKFLLGAGGKTTVSGTISFTQIHVTSLHRSDHLRAV
jgi:transposase-like protein